MLRVQFSRCCIVPISVNHRCSSTTRIHARKILPATSDQFEGTEFPTSGDNALIDVFQKSDSLRSKKLLDKSEKKLRKNLVKISSKDPISSSHAVEGELFDVDFQKSISDIQGLSFLELYRSLKAQYPENYLLALQNGDFYEFFDEDAKRASTIANIVLTKKMKVDEKTRQKIEIPFSGFPVRTLDAQLPKFVKQGVFLILGEQTSGSVETKIHRSITRVVTPGTLVEESVLDSGNNFLLAISLPFIPKVVAQSLQEGKLLQDLETATSYKVGMAWTDISTGFLTTKQCCLLDLVCHLDRIAPKEIIFTSRNSIVNDYLIGLAAKRDIPISPKDAQIYLVKSGKSYFSTLTQNMLRKEHSENYQLTEKEFEALSALHHYLRETQITRIPSLRYM